MPETSMDVSNSIATRVIIILLIVAAVFTIASIFVIDLIAHNVYAASYYTLSSLFDANGEGSTAFIASVLGSQGFNYAFYGFFVVSVVDGLAKAVIVGFLIAAFINLLSSIDIKSKFEIITAKHMKGHVIICGYSMLAERLSNDLKKRNNHFVVVDKSPEKVNILRDLGYNVVEGDFTDRKVLENASLSRAKAIVFTTESDFTNLLGIVTARHAYPKIKVIARARSEVSVREMQRGGADLCLVPEAVAGIELGESITKL